MRTRVGNPLSRRQILSAAMLGAGTLIAGCAGARRPHAVARRPIWGDDVEPRVEPRAPTPEPVEAVADANPNTTFQVLPRERWTRERPIMTLANPMGQITAITVHHDGMPPVTLRTERDAAERIDLIRRAHIGRGWADIGYHYIIDPQGRIWQGRPRNLQGAHVKDHNEHNLGIMVLGNFVEQRPTAAALSSLDAFILANMRMFRVSLHSVQTHQELATTACPGTNLQAHMERARNRGGAIAANV
jgi:hypothetical protein